MAVERRNLRLFHAMTLGCIAAFGLGGCSADLALFRADSSWWSSSTKNTPTLSRSAPAESLMGPGGSCPPAAAEAPHAVGLGMTECEVLHAYGATGLIDIGTNERGERAVVLTYPEGEHAGIYRFTSGLLVSVERVPEAPKPQRPQRRARPRQNT